MTIPITMNTSTKATPIATYNWYRERFWLKMPPRQRRIARLIIWTTALEFVVFLFVFVIYWLELGRA